jgi:RNAse (barnase) inhibitor barstar
MYKSMIIWPKNSSEVQIMLPEKIGHETQNLWDCLHSAVKHITLSLQRYYIYAISLGSNLQTYFSSFFNWVL